MADKLVRVKIAESCDLHHHKGREVGPGDEIEVSESSLPWLREQGVIAPEKAKPKTRKSTKKRAAPSEKGATEPLEDDNAGRPEEAGDTPTEG